MWRKNIAASGVLLTRSGAWGRGLGAGDLLGRRQERGQGSGLWPRVKSDLLWTSGSGPGAWPPGGPSSGEARRAHFGSGSVSHWLRASRGLLASQGRGVGQPLRSALCTGQLQAASGHHSPELGDSCSGRGPGWGAHRLWHLSSPPKRLHFPQKKMHPLIHFMISPFIQCCLSTYYVSKIRATIVSKVALLPVVTDERDSQQALGRNGAERHSKRGHFPY